MDTSAADRGGGVNVLVGVYANNGAMFEFG